jgi:hypothetical protein
MLKNVIQSAGFDCDSRKRDLRAWCSSGQVVWSMPRFLAEPLVWPFFSTPALVRICFPMQLR